MYKNVQLCSYSHIHHIVATEIFNCYQKLVTLYKYYHYKKASQNALHFAHMLVILIRPVVGLLLLVDMTLLQCSLD